MKTAIIIDSTAYANETIKNHPDVYELFLTATFEDGTHFLDSSEIAVQEDFLRNLKSQINYQRLLNLHQGTT